LLGPPNHRVVVGPDDGQMLPYMNSPRAPAQAIFWKKPFIVVFYSLAALGGPILIALATLAGVGFLIIRMLRRRRPRAGIEAK
jgi:hypothetical protein